MELTKDKSTFGWGSDADKKNRPAHKMWHLAAKGTGAHWITPMQQRKFKDFISIERPRVTRVFGTSVPPKGLSGLIRKVAFKSSEGTFSHWMLLLFADRVGIFEGIISDVTQGKFPHLLLERGWRMDKKFKTKRYYKVIILNTILFLAGVALAAQFFI